MNETQASPRDLQESLHKFYAREGEDARRRSRLKHICVGAFLLLGSFGALLKFFHVVVFK